MEHRRTFLGIAAASLLPIGIQAQQTQTATQKRRLHSRQPGTKSPGTR